MKLLVIILFLSLGSFAETYEYKIENMHCGGCKAMVKSVVCGLPGIKNCNVEVGSMKLTSEEGKPLDQIAITKALNDLNKKNKEDYKIVSSKKIESK